MKRRDAKKAMLASLATITGNMTCEDCPYEDCGGDTELAESLLREISDELHRRSERLS